MSAAPASIHTFVGKVVHGKGLGRTVGMPTANIDIAPAAITVPPGVYAARIHIGAETYAALTNIGPRPSVDDEERPTVEAHILDFDRDIYDRIVALDLTAFLRPTQKFPTLAAVKAVGTVEGYSTLPAMKALAEKYGVSAPITRELYDVCFGDKTPKDALDALTDRPKRHEGEIFW
jgi:hypothetical protein